MNASCVLPGYWQFILRKLEEIFFHYLVMNNTVEFFISSVTALNFSLSHVDKKELIWLSRISLFLAHQLCIYLMLASTTPWIFRAWTFFSWYIYGFLVTAHSPDGYQRPIYCSNNVRKSCNIIKNCVLWHLLTVELKEIWCCQAFGNSSDIEALEMPWRSPTSEKKSAFARYLRVHKT